MSRILSHELATDWRMGLQSIFGSPHGNLRGNGLQPPTRQALQRATWLAVGMVDMAKRVDRIRKDGDGGLIFQDTKSRTTWRCEADGSCSRVDVIGDESSRRTELAGSLP